MFDFSRHLKFFFLVLILNCGWDFLDECPEEMTSEISLDELFLYSVKKRAYEVGYMPKISNYLS